MLYLTTVFKMLVQVNHMSHVVNGCQHPSILEDVSQNYLCCCKIMKRKVRSHKQWEQLICLNAAGSYCRQLDGVAGHGSLVQQSSGEAVKQGGNGFAPTLLPPHTLLPPVSGWHTFLLRYYGQQ